MLFTVLVLHEKNFACYLLTQQNISLLLEVF